ncbi:MAG TPA: DinB family protein [Thermoanaerobaculia bacterium]|nr:DinB family protein [Thermoanaerobaculia bacterium]
MSDDKPLRDHLVALLEGGHAHATFDAAVTDLAPELRGARPAGAPHSPWQLLEHLRLAQWDILEFSRDPKHVSPKWPEGYWPEAPAPPDAQAWDASIAAFRRDLKEMEKLVADPESDLFTPFPWGDGQTLLREALLIVDHNAYHLGQLVLVRRLVGGWKEE